MAHFLIISYEFAPKNNPRAFRWHALAQEFLKQGHTMDVLTSLSSNLPEYEEMEDGIKVYRVNEGLIGQLRQKLAGTHSEIAGKSTGGGVSKPARLKVLLKKVYDKTWKNLYWPDFSFLWIAPATRKAMKLVKENNYDAMLTVSLPFSSHVVGRRLNRKFPTLTWLMDVGDPYCFMHSTQTNNYRLYGRFNKYYEKRCFKSCDAVSVTTEETRLEYLKLFGYFLSEKIQVMPPLLDKLPTVKKSKVQKKTVDLYFVGTLYKTIRSPEFLLKMFSYMLNSWKEDKKPVLHFIGSLNDASECFDDYAHLIESGHIVLHGKVRKEEVVKMTSGADILVNIGNDTHYQLPSKVVEYAATGKAILNIVNHTQDSSVDFFKNYSAALNILENESMAVKKLEKFISKPPAMTAPKVKKFIEPYLVENVALSYLRAIKF